MSSLPINRIGTLNEKPLHAALKAIYAQDNSQLEHRIGRYVVDIFDSGHITEIQTANFSSISKKLQALLPKYPITLVYPIAQEKWIIKLPRTSEGKPTRRKSPKKQNHTALFLELVRIPTLLAHPNLQIDIVLTQEEEVRQFDGNRGWRKKGWVTEERKLIQILERQSVQSPRELLELFSIELPESFLTSDLAKLMNCPQWVAQKAAYCFKHLQLIEPIGKQRNAILYAPVTTPTPL